MKNTLVVNLFAGPGAGKTTAAHELVAVLKKRGADVEYVAEYAKELVYDCKWDLLKDQEHVTTTQHNWINRLNGKVDIVITDSPVLLGKIYGENRISEEYSKTISSYHKSIPSFNIFIERDKDATKFDQNGRIQNYEESCALDEKIKDMLKSENVYFGTYHQEMCGVIADNILKTYNRLNSQKVTETKTLSDFIKAGDKKALSQNDTVND